MKNANDVRNKSKSRFDLPLFSYASVSAATDNFSEGKKLGEGGFGPVYKVGRNTWLEVQLKH